MEVIEVNKVGEVTVIVPRMRRLDALAAPSFKQSVLDVIGSGENRLVLDLEGVDFIDSSGLGAMVSLLKALGGRGAIAVCNASGGVQSLFRLTRMDKVFSLLPNRDEAITKVTG